MSGDGERVEHGMTYQHADTIEGIDALVRGGHGLTNQEAKWLLEQHAAAVVVLSKQARAMADLEISGTWLVERVEGDLIPGYGTLPGSDMVPIIDLSTLRGWPQPEPGEIEAIEAEDRAKEADRG